MTTKRHSNPGLLHLDGPPPELLGTVPPPEDDGDGESRFPDVAYVILGHVATSPNGLHGYHLGRVLTRATPQLPPMRLGQLYRILRRLERAALVTCHVESESSRLRYRFTVTPRGEAVLQDWLSTMPRGTGSVCQQLLLRLGFAAQIPQAALLRLVDDAAVEAKHAIEALAKNGMPGRDRRSEPDSLFTTALRARLATDRCWLEEVRHIVAQSPVAVAKRAVSA